MVLDLTGRKSSLHGRPSEVQEESGEEQGPEEKVAVKSE